MEVSGGRNLKGISKMAESAALPLLGEALERARKRKGISQAALAIHFAKHRPKGDKDRDADERNAQTYLAKLENGRIANPRPDDLAWLAAELDVDFSIFVAAILKDRLLPADRPDLSSLALPLEKGMKTLPEIAEWERTPEHRLIWVIAERYVDDHLRDFRQAVCDILKRGDRIEFFLPQGRQEDFEDYKAMLSEEEEMPRLDDRLIFHPLSNTQSPFIANPFVLANPMQFEGEFPQGFVILNDANGLPTVGVRMSRAEAIDRARALMVFRRKSDRLTVVPASVGQ